MTELTENEWQEKLDSEIEETQYENTETLVKTLVGALENGESFTTHSAIALARAYELEDRLID